MKAVVSLIIGISVAAGLNLITGCDKQSDNTDNTEITEPIEITLNAPEQLLAEKGKSFTFSLLSSVISSEETDKNISISPFSLNSSLAMLLNAVAGASKDSVKKAMGYDDFTISEVNSYFKKVREAVLSTDNTTKVIIANSIWYRQEATPETPFVNINKSYFNAEIKPIDFSDQGNVKLINDWCSDKTNGLINEAIDIIKPDDFMYMINALYFKAIWQKGYEFDKKNTVSKSFNLARGGVAQVNMMKAEFKLPYYSDQNLSMISMPYGNGAFSMLFFLPAPTKDPLQTAVLLSNEEYLNSVIEEAYEKNQQQTVRVEVPKFKFRFNTSFNDILKERGMAIVYDPLRADFTDSFRGVPLVVTDVKQLNYINVDEEGTEAAAVTVVTVGVTSVPQVTEFRLDRPFLFAIRENTSGVILFAGRVGNPALEGN